jgi:pyruvate formate lyase activating enzyme
MARFFQLGSARVFGAGAPTSSFVREAMYWEKSDLGVKCGLCPFNCYIPEGAKGKCRVRVNKDDVLYTEVYGQAAALALDPIEKKPVFHMLPGSAILSVATNGCPLKCEFCQNWTLSQTEPESMPDAEWMPPEKLVEAALEHHVPSIAYTYSEPVIFYEYMLETAKLAHEKGLRNVVVTSGYINPEPLRKLAPYLDVVKVDLKGMDPDFYRKEVGGELSNVLATLKILKQENILTEVVNLVVPQRNDKEEDFVKLSRWVRDNLGQDTPLFFSRFHPDYRLKYLPPTPVETLENARAIAMKEGLRYVYLGNVPGSDGENTYCPKCHTLLIQRNGYLILKDILKDGRCPKCGEKIPGIWK